MTKKRDLSTAGIMVGIWTRATPMIFIGPPPDHRLYAGLGTAIVSGSGLENQMIRKVGTGLFLCGLGLAGPLGCADNRPRPMDAALFIPPSIADSNSTSDPHSGAVPATVPTETSQSDSPKNASILPTTTGKPFDTLQPLDPLQPAPTTAPAEAQSTETAALAVAPLVPATESSSTSGQGVYLTLGAVLAQVNNTGIYANQVLAPLKKEFAAKARESDPDSFRSFAEKEIGKQLDEAIKDELYFAMSYRALSEDDRKLADQITMQIRLEKVTAAGGSVERARRQAAEDGEDFDRSMRKEYRKIVYEIYSHRKIEPLVQVTADDMRDFYTMNVGKLYSEKDRAQFRVIEIDPKAFGGVQPATDKINSLREKAVHGADFAALASADNSNASLKSRAGNPLEEGQWMDRNTYLIDAVEAAVWKLEPGQITPLIEADGKFYIAKLEAKHLGAVRPFDDQTVQDDINARLRQQQMAALLAKSEEESTDDQMINTDDRRIQVAVDMAMQTYAQAH